MSFLETINNKNKSFTTRQIVDEIVRLIRSDDKDYIIFDISNTDKNIIDSVFRITECDANKDFYSAINIYYLDGCTLAAEKSDKPTSAIQLQCDALCHVYDLLYCFATGCNTFESAAPELMEDVARGILMFKKKMKESDFNVVVSYCLSTVADDELFQFTKQSDIDYIVNSIEKVRYYLTGSSLYHIKHRVAKKCARMFGGQR